MIFNKNVNFSFFAVIFIIFLNFATDNVLKDFDLDFDFRPSLYYIMKYNGK